MSPSACVFLCFSVQFTLLYSSQTFWTDTYLCTYTCYLFHSDYILYALIHRSLPFLPFFSHLLYPLKTFLLFYIFLFCLLRILLLFILPFLDEEQENKKYCTSRYYTFEFVWMRDANFFFLPLNDAQPSGYFIFCFQLMLLHFCENV